MPKLQCERCGHEWVSRKKNPRSCPCCKSYIWAVPREEEPEVGQPRQGKMK